MKPRHLQYDTLDDRKEVYYLLTRLSPRLRIEWLAWCCDNAIMPASDDVRPVVAQRTQGETLEIFFDFWLLCTDYRLDVGRALNVLVEMVRHRDHWRAYAERHGLVRRRDSSRLRRSGTVVSLPDNASNAGVLLDPAPRPAPGTLLTA